MKTCTKCGEGKPLGEFNRNRDGKAGRQSQCKKCKRAYCKAWHDRNRERSRAVSRKYHEANRDAILARGRKWYRGNGRVPVLLRAARSRAKRANVPFELTKDWLADKLATGKCEVTKISFQTAPFGVSPYSPSIDRIIPERGYIPENCRVVLFALNVAMRDWGLGVVEEIAQTVLERKNGR